MNLVTILGVKPDISFTEVIIWAQDQSNTVVGHWTTDDPSLRIMSCGGIIHNSHADKTQVRASWHASSHVNGTVEIQYLYLIIRDDRLDCVFVAQR